MNHITAKANITQKMDMNTAAKIQGILVIAAPSMVPTVCLGEPSDNGEIRHRQVAKYAS